ncbi:DNA polymerase III subunit epsilon [Mucilaginibacter sp. PPCGB 2223]|uniref:3'-5' exonuclease n=1 Tax=Mucilaginibacter sp. PPCGB 2223 TaxID=1886027 RepID=UPI0008247F06|nr:3'-5' exonuclease [Mucilaginibacter sp. PPCGB 2223]OCX54779.1 DNA polymerase III subunit epsilon [Mucilaginibacter sp. PPCGB 2223]
MQKYTLFIDTETSGLPKNWKLPYADNANWPTAVQVSWVIYDEHRREVKREDHYVSNNDLAISKQAYKIHGLSAEFLSQHGDSRKQVMKLLYQDLEKYKPLVVGHFVELDYHITGVDFFRVEMEQPMNRLPMFCTMLATKNMVRNPQMHYLKLGELYELLFNKPLGNQHNAMTDALATAECFFELQRTEAIDDDKITRQQIERERLQKPVLKGGCGVPVLVMLIFMALIIYWL